MKKLLLALFLLFILVPMCYSVEIDLSVIASIESSHNPFAFNKKSGATGLYQITPICLEDYNLYYIRPRVLFNGTRHSVGTRIASRSAYKSLRMVMSEMYDAVKCEKVAVWTFSKRIPQLLKHYGHDVTVKNALIAYNRGISYVGKPLCKETEDYIRKYYEGLKFKQGWGV